MGSPIYIEGADADSFQPAEEAIAYLQNLSVLTAHNDAVNCDDGRHREL